MELWGGTAAAADDPVAPGGMPTVLYVGKPTGMEAGNPLFGERQRTRWPITGNTGLTVFHSPPILSSRRSRMQWFWNRRRREKGRDLGSQSAQPATELAGPEGSTSGSSKSHADSYPSSGNSDVFGDSLPNGPGREHDRPLSDQDAPPQGAWAGGRFPIAGGQKNATACFGSGAAGIGHFIWPRTVG